MASSASARDWAAATCSLKLPGFGGGLDYRPVIKALADIRYTGLVEIFMHPTPRGVPILPTVPEITSAINRSRDYLERCRREVLG